MKTFWKLIKGMIILIIILVAITWVGKGPSASKFDNAWNKGKMAITKVFGHEFKEAPTQTAVSTQAQVRVDTSIISEELLEPNKWLTVMLKDGQGGYRELKVLWKSGPIYRRWLNKDGAPMITQLGIGDTFDAAKVMRVDDNTLKPLEKNFHDGISIQGAAAVQFMAANGNIPVRVKLKID